jgi:preprotein translocase subunit SecA
MLQNILTKIIGTKSDRDTKVLLPIVDKINTIYKSLKLKSDEDLANRTLHLLVQKHYLRKEAKKYDNKKNYIYFFASFLR